MNANNSEKHGKLAASSLASLWIAFINVALVIWYGKLIFTEDTMIDRVVFGILAANIVFFYYFEVHTETDPEEQLRLISAGKLEWWLRVLNQSVLSWVIFQFGKQ